MFYPSHNSAGCQYNKAFMCIQWHRFYGGSYFNVFPTAEEAMEVDEDLIEIAEEAELIQAERMIEDEWTIGPRAGKNDRKKGNKEESVREVEELMLAMNLDNVDIQAENSQDGWEVTILRC